MFARPTVTNLRDQAINDILIGTGLPALLRRSPLRAMAYGQAGLAQGQYGYPAPPQGGSADDYDAWVRTVPGVTRVWLNPLGAGPGTVVLYTMFDLAEAAHGGFPQGADGGPRPKRGSIDARIALYSPAQAGG